jgi:hypothetical protein
MGTRSAMRELEAEEVEAVTSVMEFWISQLPQLEPHI